MRVTILHHLKRLNDITMRVDYLNKFKDESKVTADKFGHLVVQSSGGRMKPLATLNREIVQKLSGKSSFMGMVCKSDCFRDDYKT